MGNASPSENINLTESIALPENADPSESINLMENTALPASTRPSANEEPSVKEGLSERINLSESTVAVRASPHSAENLSPTVPNPGSAKNQRKESTV